MEPRRKKCMCIEGSLKSAMQRQMQRIQHSVHDSVYVLYVCDMKVENGFRCLDSCYVINVLTPVK